MIRLDTTHGLLHVDGVALTGLLARVDDAVAGRAPAGDSLLVPLEDLRTGGALVGNDVEPALAPLLDTIAAPWALVRVGVEHGETTREHQLWFGPRCAVLAEDRGAGQYALGALAPTATPAEILRLTGLGARRRDTTTPPDLRLPAPAVEALLGGDPAPLLETLQPGHLADTVAAGDWRVVSVHCEWSPELAHGTPRTTGLIVVDTAAGPLLLAPAGETVAATLTSTAQLWPALITLTQPPANLDTDGAYARATRRPLGLRLT